MSESTAQAADALVVFGISGDLARKMTFRSLYRLESAGRLTCPVIGVAFDDWSDDHLHQAARDAIAATEESPNKNTVAKLVKRMTYVQGDFKDPDTYQRLAAKLDGASHPLFYLEIPPSLFAPVTEQLGKAGLTEGARVLYEKPFGHDLESARALNRDLHAVLDESQILRIDHFLGKQPVLDLHYLRFANALLEPLWNRAHIAAVQISMAEDFGVEDRGSFYDAVGALRDVVQNHLLQVLALVAMEPPVGPGSDDLWDKKVDVFRAMSDVDASKAVRGQYEGYGEVRGVKPGSTTETYVAMRLDINSLRWAGVPFFIRAGKALAARSTEVRVVFKRPPRLPFLEQPLHTDANQLIFRIDPDAAVRLNMLSKGSDGTGSRNVHLDLPFVAELGKPPEPYERLLNDALTGDRALFTRQDAVEETWRVLQPLLDHPNPPVSYERGSWGPVEAEALVRGHAPWQKPWLPGDDKPKGAGRTGGKGAAKANGQNTTAQ